MALTATKVGQYKKQTIDPVTKQTKVITVFRYTVSGTAEELAEYEKASGENFRTDDATGKPLWFTPAYKGENVQLSITTNGKVVAETNDMDEIASMVEQYGAETARLILMMRTGK